MAKYMIAHCNLSEKEIEMHQVENSSEYLALVNYVQAKGFYKAFLTVDAVKYFFYDIGQIIEIKMIDESQKCEEQIINERNV